MMGFFEQIKSSRLRTWKSVTLTLAFIALGFNCSVFGPAILDLQLLVGTTIEKITLTIPARSLGSVFGSVLCGFVIGFIDHQIILCACLLMLVLSLLAIGFCITITQLLAVVFVNGISIGAIVNCGNCWTLHMWGKENPPFMQLIHFAFGLGAFFAPFFAEPFLLQKPAQEILLEIPNTIGHDHDGNLSTTSLPLTMNLNESIAFEFRREDVHIQFAFYAVAAFASAILTICTITYVARPANPMHPSRQANMQEGVEAANQIKKAMNDAALTRRLSTKSASGSMVRREHAASIVSTCSRPEMGAVAVLAQEQIHESPLRPTPLHWKATVVLMAALFMHCVYGVELSFGGLLATFAVKCDLRLSKSTASYMTSFYWAAFTFFRLFSIALVSCLNSRSMMHVSLCLIAIGNLVLLPFGNRFEWALWAGTGLMGIGVSSVYPTLWGFLEDVIPVTGKITSLITIASCLGEFVIPIFIGYYIETDPMYYLYIIFGYGFIAYGVFIVCCLVANNITALRSSNQNSSK